MDALHTALSLVWVLVCLAFILVGAPALALTTGDDTPRTPIDPGAVLVWSWLTIAFLAPLTATMRGFNWGTALLMAAVWPTAVWLRRHRGHQRVAFRQLVRSLVFEAVTPRRAPSARSVRQVVPGVVAGVLLLGAVLFYAGAIDLRLPVPADFDTLARTRQILGGVPAWDPLAALAAVATRVSASEALAALGAIRLALVALTAAASAAFVRQIIGPRPLAFIAPLAVLTLTPLAPLGTWAVALLVLIGASSLLQLRRAAVPSQHAWHAAAAFLLAAAHVVPFMDRPDVLWRVSAGPRYLEHRAAPTQAMRIARLSQDEDWVLAGAPEQQLEIDRRGRFIDLAQFVSRFHGRSGNPAFRFDLGKGRLFVIVEKQPLDVSRAAPGVRFVSAQPAAYRAPLARARLAQRARDICDEYRRTHAGTAIEYDDDVLRVYRIDL